MGLAHEKKSYLQEKANLFEIGSFIFEIDFFYSFISIWVLEGPDISTFQ